MKLALIGTGKIVEDALFAMEPVETIERIAILQDHIAEIRRKNLQNSMQSKKFTQTMKNYWKRQKQILFISD